MTASRRLYLDNAATTFPKPNRVHEAMARYATQIGASPGRGAYTESIEGARLIRVCRERLCRLIGGRSPDHVVFTLNTSDALNLAIRGMVAARRKRLIERGEHDRPIHLVTTAMDHNSILRPFNALAADGLSPRVEWTCVEADPESGLVDPDAIRAAIRSDTLLVGTVQASNVTGTVQPIREIGAMCRDMGVPLLVDGAQSVGRVPIDVDAMSIDLLAFPGHKALMGPLGTGALYIRPGLERLIATVREGGTGTVSELDVQPESMPDKYEPGSHNTIGIVGLGEGVAWVLETGVDTIERNEQDLIRQVIAALARTDDFPGLRLIGPQTASNRIGVFSFVHESSGPQELATMLEAEFGILTRAGIHCAPRAHGTFGTTDRGGALRISFGPFVSPQDVEYTLNALSEVCRVLGGAAVS